MEDGKLYFAYNQTNRKAKSDYPNLQSLLYDTKATIIAQREWIEEPVIETKTEEQQTLPTKEQINVAGAMEQSSTPVLEA